MSSSASGSAQSSAASTGSQNLSNVLGSIGQSSTDSPSATQSSGSSAAASTAASSASSGSSPSSSAAASTTSASASNTITDAPQLSSASSASISSLSGAPSLTSGDIPKLTDLPTLSGYYSYPPPTVPPMQNAPYLHKAHVPENFVFIIVGVAIAFVAILIVGWRVFTSWSINRRFQRHDGGGGGFAGHRNKTVYTPLADMKQHAPAQPSHNMKDLGKLPKTFSSVPSLFFSPTLEVAKNSARPLSSRAESRQHLPSGHYRDASDGAR